MAFINFNGKLIEENQPIVDANSRGLRFGDGLFETLKYKNGHLVLIDEHLARLWNGMKAFQFDIPKLMTPDKLESEIIALVKKNKLSAARIRMTVFRGHGGLFDPQNHTPSYLLQASALPETNGDWNENGLHLCIYKDARKSADAFSSFKHNNFLPYLMGALFAKKEKCNDALILNNNHFICDSTIANVFMIKDGSIFTPPLHDGCIAGIMRSFVIQWLQEHQFDIKEKTISENELLEADEIFLTNSIYNIRWASAIAQQPLRCTISRQIFNAIKQTNPDVFC